MQRPRCLYFRDVRPTAIGAAPARDARRSAASTEPTPSSAPATSAWPRTHRIWRWRSSRWMRSSSPATRPANAASPRRLLPRARDHTRPGTRPAPGRADRRRRDADRAGAAPVWVPQGARPAVLRVRTDVGSGGARHRRRDRPGGEGRRRRSGDRAVAAARGRTSLVGRPAGPSCGSRRRRAPPTARNRCPTMASRCELVQTHGRTSARHRSGAAVTYPQPRRGGRRGTAGAGGRAAEGDGRGPVRRRQPGARLRARRRWCAAPSQRVPSTASTRRAAGRASRRAAGAHRLQPCHAALRHRRVSFFGQPVAVVVADRRWRPPRTARRW